MSTMSRRRWRIGASFGALASLLATVGLGVPGGASAVSVQRGWAARALPCERPVFVPGQGRSCAVPGGWLVLLGDGTTVLTHGGDALPANVPFGGGYVAPNRPVCAGDPQVEFHHLVIYAHASDRPSRVSTMRAEIRSMIAVVNGMLVREAAEFGRRLQFRVACDKDEATVQPVELRTAFASTTMETIVTDLRRLGYASSRAKYWVWFDGRPPGSPVGQGTVEFDDRRVASNRSNVGPGYGVSYGVRQWQGGAGVLMHENGHTLGAVQRSAPRNSGAAHCNDGLDVMCYDDNGPFSNYSPAYCYPMHYDCRHDTYFNPKPKKSSYLARYWNLASPLNRFLAGCLYKTGVLSVGLASVDVDDAVDDVDKAADGKIPEAAIAARNHLVPKACWGRPFALSGATLSPAVLDGAEGILPVRPQSTIGGQSVPDFNVCWLKGSSPLRCHTGAGTDTGTVPDGATRLRVFLNAGAQGTYVLNAV